MKTNMEALTKRTEFLLLFCKITEYEKLKRMASTRFHMNLFQCGEKKIAT
jgi:hypothetical protein